MIIITHSESSNLIGPLPWDVKVYYTLIVSIASLLAYQLLNSIGVLKDFILNLDQQWNEQKSCTTVVAKQEQLQACAV
jgi:hypothetical protein